MNDTPTNPAPLELPSGYDANVHMPASETDHGRFHVTRDAARLARNLVANGAEPDLANAVAVIDAVLSCQERDSQNPHYGNFYWMAEDTEVVDLNAVSFILAEFIPLMLDYRDRVHRAGEMAGDGEALCRRMEDSVRLGIAAVERLDVHVGYTNIAVFDIFMRILGGELLGDRALAERGAAKLAKWIAFTNREGHPLEFNSPTYTPIALRTLEALAERCGDRRVQVSAAVMSARLALSVGLHLHPETGRWAGPHGRSYVNAVNAGTTARETELIEEFTTGRHRAMRGLLTSDRGGSTIVERTANQENINLTTYFSRSYSLGVAARQLHAQSNVIIAYYLTSENEEADVFYSRYLTDDKWYGDFYHPTDRSNARNLLDEGEFLGVQQGSSVVGAYSPRGLEQKSGAKAVLVWSNVAHVDEVRIDGQVVDDFPATVGEGSTVGVSAGRTLFAVRPMTLTSMGSGVGAELVVRGDQLVLEMVQYRGQRKDFWELRNPGPFYRGRPLTACYLELGEREEFDSLSDFMATVSSGVWEVDVDPERTYTGSERRRWRGGYRRSETDLNLEVDLYGWEMIVPDEPRDGEDRLMLDSPRAAQRQSGSVGVEGATLSSSSGPIWLYGDREREVWVAGICAPPGKSGDVSLRVPSGTVQLYDVEACLIIWERGEVTVQSYDSGRMPLVSGGVLKTWSTPE